MEEIEEQWLEQFRVAAHLLEVETLKARERNGVLRIVEEKPELSSTQPFGECIGELARERVGQNVERAKLWVQGVKTLDLLKQFPLRRGIEVFHRRAEKHLDEERRKS